MVEVKSTTRVKEIHEPDVAVQYQVLKGAGIKVVDAGVLTLNTNYIFDGENLDLGQLFEFHEIKEAAEALQLSVSNNLESFKAVLAADSAPNISPGPHCHSPYECPYFSHCTKDLLPVDDPITDLPSLAQGKRSELNRMGIESIKDVPPDFPLTALQSVVRTSVLTGQDYVSTDLAGALVDVEYPIYYLDFETCGSAIPKFAGTHAYDAVVFQFSLHIENREGEMVHHEYLHPDSSDPRRCLAEALLSLIGSEGSICVYSGYESGVIRALSKWLPDLSPDLDAMLARLWDLLPIIRRNYYHPDFHGSFSIKKVLPALISDLSYSALDIQDGQSASRSWLESVTVLDGDARDAIHVALLEYCKLDTLAMVRLRHALYKRSLS